ncbi:hypothetical protein A3860_26415 [Niastella vici]|uniref:Uncharacterized protein n=2 Tax=Niastella vici TaxID=1703345 RepID=A0A1V9FX34_9BACT|nr:hypothetical protein A3860_26415 [Niastella vici]
MNTDEAMVYYSKFKANPRSASAPGLIEILQRTITFMQRREAGVKSGYSGNLPEKIAVSKQ